MVNIQVDQVEQWVDIIEDHMDFNNSDFYINRDCVGIIDAMLKDHSQGLIKGDYFAIKCERNYSSEARTLPIKSVGIQPVIGGTWEVHGGVWEVHGQYCEDYYEWISNFVAFFHTDYCSEWVIGNHEDYVLASSENIYHKFINHYPISRWDYYDI